MFNEIIKKIELQSVLVLFTTLLFGYLLLNKDNSLSTPAGILGSITIAFGVLYTFGSFFSNQIKESYKDVILEYKAIISTMRSNQRYMDDTWKNTFTSQKGTREIGKEYQILDSKETSTQEG